MVAPNYSAQRSALAKTLGLGRKAAPAPAPVTEKRGRGRPRIVQAEQAQQAHVGETAPQDRDAEV
jgi:hypothetical protein